MFRCNTCFLWKHFDHKSVLCLPFYFSLTHFSLFLSHFSKTHTQMLIGVNMTYKPTYFKTSFKLHSQLRVAAAAPPTFSSSAATQFHCCGCVLIPWYHHKHRRPSWLSFFLSPSSLVFLTITSCGCPDYCCHGNRGAGPSQGDLETSWSKDPYVIGAFFLGACVHSFWLKMMCPLWQVYHMSLRVTSQNHSRQVMTK